MLSCDVIVLPLAEDMLVAPVDEVVPVDEVATVDELILLVAVGLCVVVSFEVDNVVVDVGTDVAERAFVDGGNVVIVGGFVVLATVDALHLSLQ